MFIKQQYSFHYRSEIWLFWQLKFECKIMSSFRIRTSWDILSEWPDYNFQLSHIWLNEKITRYSSKNLFFDVANVRQKVTTMTTVFCRCFNTDKSLLYEVFENGLIEINILLLIYNYLIKLNYRGNNYIIIISS